MLSHLALLQGSNADLRQEAASKEVLPSMGLSIEKVLAHISFDQVLQGKPSKRTYFGNI